MSLAVDGGDRGTDGLEVAQRSLPLETRTEAQGIITAWLPQWEGQNHDITALIILSLPEIHGSMR